MKRVQAQMEKQKKKVEEEKKGTKISFDDEMRRFEAGKKYLADNYNIKVQNRLSVFEVFPNLILFVYRT